MNFQELLETAKYLAPKTTAEIKAAVDANLAARRPAFAGLTYTEIQEYNRASMADAFAAAES